MASTQEWQKQLNVEQMLQRITTARQLTRDEHLQLVTIALAGYKLKPEQQREIEKIFDSIHNGQFKFID